MRQMNTRWKAIRHRPAKHIPSGILIVWQGGDGKIHTQSIAIQYPLWLNKESSMKATIDHAKTELLLHQLDTIGINGYELPAPMITTGLTRQEAKLAYKQELSRVGLVELINKGIEAN